MNSEDAHPLRGLYEHGHPHRRRLKLAVFSLLVNAMDARSRREAGIRQVFWELPKLYSPGGNSPPVTTLLDSLEQSSSTDTY